MTPLRLDHVAVAVADVAASLRFYREILGLPLLSAQSGEDWGGHDWLMMVFGLGDGRQLALVGLRGAALGKDGLPRDVRHLAFATTSADELERWRRRLEEHGIEHWVEDHGTQRSVYFVDPDGSILEITTPPSVEVSAAPEEAAALVRAWLGTAR